MIEQLTCPFPIRQYPHVLLAHGGGGKLMQQLIEKMFSYAFGPKPVHGLHDSTVLNLPVSKIAFTTDSFVVKPLFFPGGDIGSLAVNGTVNDLAMSGAKPLYLSLGFIIEEGLSMESLWNIVRSIKNAADEAGVTIVTGDTKVVDRGKGDGIFINTSGIGIIEHSLNIAPGFVKSGDAIIISGDVGRHGIAIMASREGLAFETTIQSDCAALNGLVHLIIKSGADVHCMRDLTRGGLASALNEIAQDSGHPIEIEEAKVPVIEEVASACAMMGFDPLYVANEGLFMAIVSKEIAADFLTRLKQDKNGINAAIIGEVNTENPGRVIMKSRIGGKRVVTYLTGEQLPRIC